MKSTVPFISSEYIPTGWLRVAADISLRLALGVGISLVFACLDTTVAAEGNLTKQPLEFDSADAIGPTELANGNAGRQPPDPATWQSYECVRRQELFWTPNLRQSLKIERAQAASDAGDLQQRPRRAVHRSGLHGRAQEPWHPDQHGR